jgi:hypothetical protein
MKPYQKNGFVRGALRIIDIVVGMYLNRSVRWEKEPFRKATGTEWRVGWFFVACFPICMMAFAGNAFFPSFLDAAGNTQHSTVWLYAGFIGFALIGAAALIKIGQKVPLYFSIPTALAAWTYCVWLTGFHSEKILHS